MAWIYADTNKLETCKIVYKVMRVNISFLSLVFFPVLIVLLIFKNGQELSVFGIFYIQKANLYL